MTTRRQSMAGRGPDLSFPHPHRLVPSMVCRCRRIWVHQIVILVLALTSLPSTGAGHVVSFENYAKDDGCRSYGEGSSSVYVGSDYPVHSSLKNVCGDSSSFCFPTTLPGYVDKEDGCRAPYQDYFENLVSTREESGLPLEPLVYVLSDGRKVLCSSIDAESGASDRLASKHKNVDHSDVGLCKGKPLPDAWMHKSSGSTVAPHAGEKEIKSSLYGGPLSPHVEINPPVLDWGVNRLYHPSLAYLTVSNTYNDSFLQVYELFSSDPQYYAYDFEKLTLAPGEAALISVVFLPRWLGSSSSHLVLQTSFGGFIIHAKGIGAESPYLMQPLVGFDVSSDGRLSKVMSLHNPFNDILHVEEVTTWISFFSENTSRSASVVCRAETFPQPPDKLSSSRSGNELGWSLVGIRPQRHWEIGPHDTEPILEISLSLLFEGSLYGAICIQLQNTSQDVTDTIIVPLEEKVHSRVGYHSLSGSVSVFLEPLVPCDSRGSIFSFNLRNGAPHILRIVEISEVSDGIKLFKVKYMDGLILYPGEVASVGLISYSDPSNMLDILPDILSSSSNCELFVVTNDTASPQIKIPCRDLVDTCPRHKYRSDCVESKGSFIGSRSQHEKEKSSSARSGSLRSIIEDQSLIESDLLEIVVGDEFVLKNWKTQATMVNISVLEDREVIFPIVQVGAHFYKWITVKNPSEKPVVMQLLLNSGVIVDQCKSDDELSDNSSLRSILLRSTNETAKGFSIAESAILEAFVHPSGRATFGPIVFHPSSRCMWKSSVMIRNNLSGVEWLPVRGVGGSPFLVLLEGSKPVHKLEFNVELPMSLNVSTPETFLHMESTTSSCAYMSSKELYAKNTGELPLEVIKLEVSGTHCGKDGFTVHTCKGFTLAPGESTMLFISYQTDFSISVIQRDLELALAAGILVIPMKATLPAYMISFCKKPFFSKLLRKLLLLVFVFASAAVLVFFRFLPHLFSSNNEDYLMKRNHSVATISRIGKPSRIHRNPKNGRSVSEDQKHETSFISGYSDCQGGIQDISTKVQSMMDSDPLKKAPLVPPASSGKPVEEAHYSVLSEVPRTGNLRVTIAREKGRRRKKRTGGAGAGLASRLEVSSSQSGNSTPSSPLSSSASTPKQVWPLSPDTPENQFPGVAVDQIREKERVLEASAEVVPDEASLKSLDNSWSLFACEQSFISEKQTGKPVLLPSATFPGTTLRAPGVATTKFLASTSPIAPHARAPGSNLCKEKTVKRHQVNERVNDFTYSIWGNSFSARLKGNPNEVLPKVADASEGDSQSFFARGPQSLTTLSSASSVSPDLEASPTNWKWLGPIE